MRHYHFLFIAAGLLFTCSKRSRLPKIPATIVDSFEVHGLDIGQMVQDLYYENDTQLYSYNFQTREMVYFSRTKDSKIYTVQRRDPVDAEPLSSVFEDEHNRKYILTRSNVIHVYDSTSQQKLATKKITHCFQFLKKDFMVLPDHLTPIRMYGDTLVTSITYNSLDVYQDQFAEKAMAEFYLGSDSVHLIRSYIPRPGIIATQDAPFPLYCLKDHHVYLIFPGLDTIYHYDRYKHAMTKIPINNPDYVLPEPWDFKMLNAPGYDRYETKYCMSNFSYKAFFYDQERKLYYLFYLAPVDKHLDHPTLDDQAEMILVLDQNFKKIRTSSTEKRNLVASLSYFFIPGKGLVIPEFKGYDEFENTKFYIYTF